MIHIIVPSGAVLIVAYLLLMHYAPGIPWATLLFHKAW